MCTSRIILLLSIAAGIHAQDASSYISSVCEPLNSSSYPDMNAPCNQVLAIQSQCLFGPDTGLSTFYGQFSVGGSDSGSDPTNDTTTLLKRAFPIEQSPSMQRACMCESQVFDAITGCVACQRAHGSRAPEAFFDAAFLSSMRAAYCAVPSSASAAAAADPSLGLVDFLNAYVASSLPASLAAAASSAASSSAAVDSFLSRTDVSLYYTPAVSGPAAYLVAEQTASDDSLTVTALNTASGQIVPTVSSTAAAAQSSGTGVKKGSAGKTEAAAMAGVLGIAALVALF